MDLRALDARLRTRAYGLILLSASADEAVRRALWGVLGTCETLYWVGPLADKPVVEGGASCWLLECTADARAAGVREVLRRDPHAIHAIGPVDAALLPLLVNAALSGCVVVAELGAAQPAQLFEDVRALGVAPELLEACVIAAVGADGALTVVGSASAADVQGS